MHQDQKRVQEAVLPAIASRIVSDDPQAVADCTVLNRLLSQGADPLFLALTCPEQFGTLCKDLGMTPEEGLAAIQKAHVQGPGCLLVGTGLTSLGDVPDSYMPEVLWLLLAGCSACTEEGYTDEVSIQQRVGSAMKAVMRFHSVTFLAAPGLIRHARVVLRDFQANTVFTPGLNGIPQTDRDEGFYLAYKAGHKVAAVKPKGASLTFYGTIPSTSLDAEGVKVDKKISDQFGIVFGG